MQVCSFKNPFAMLTSLSELNFTFRRFTLLVKMKEVKTMTAAQATENHGDDWGLTWYLQWGIYTSIPTWNHSQNSLAAAEALTLSYAMKQGTLFWFFWKVNGNWDNNMIRISQWKEAIIKQKYDCKVKNILMVIIVPSQGFFWLSERERAELPLQ